MDPTRMLFKLYRMQKKREQGDTECWRTHWCGHVIAVTRFRNSVLLKSNEDCTLWVENSVIARRKQSGDKKVERLKGVTPLGGSKHQVSAFFEESECRITVDGHTLPVIDKQENAGASVPEMCDEFASVVEQMQSTAEQWPALLAQLKRACSRLEEGKVFCSPYIPPTKLKNAISSYAPNTDCGSVLLLYDATVFGSGKNGLALTRDSVYWKNWRKDPHSYPLSSLDSITMRESDSWLMESGIGIGVGHVNVDDEELAEVLREAMIIAKDCCLFE